MSTRKYSTDNSSDNDDTNNNNNAFNHALLLSDSQCLFTEESVATKQTFRSSYKFGTYSIKHAISSVKSSTVKCSLRNNEKTIQSHKESQGQGKTQNTEESLTVNSKVEVQATVNPTESSSFKSSDPSQNLLPGCNKREVEISKPSITSDEIISNPICVHTLFTMDLDDNSTTHDNTYIKPQLSNTYTEFIENVEAYSSEMGEKNEDELLTSSSDTSSNAWQNLEEFTTAHLEKSNIWPALNALETTYTNTNGNTSKNTTDIIDNLNEQFNYSPRRFTETLLTVIEESFAESEDTSVAFHEFLKSALREESKGFLDKISSPQLIVSQTSSDLSDLRTKYNLSGSGSDSTQYASLKKLMSPKVGPKSYRRYVKLDVRRETPVKVKRSNEIIQIKSSDAKKNYQKSPEPNKERRTPKISFPRRLEVGKANNITPYGESPRRFKNIAKTPVIVIHPGTPQPQREIRRFSVQDSDDDEYLTAESESEAPETHQSEESLTIEAEEPIASSSRKLNMSSVAYHHQEWIQAYKKVSNYQSVRHRTTAAITKTRENRTGKLEKDWLREMQQKRQRCLDLVDQLVEIEGKVDPSIAEQTISNCKPCKLTAEFVRTLCACSEYLAYRINVMNEMCKFPAKNKRCVSSLSINVEKNKDLSSHHIVVHQRKTRSPRRSLSKKNLRITSPGAKCLSPYSKSCLKRQSLKGSQSPRIDKSSIRPVSQLRCLFSPGKRAADGCPSNAKLIRGPIAASKLHERSKNERKFAHVVSPVAQYIRGIKTT